MNEQDLTSQEVIMARMLQSAMKLWQLQSLHNLDPLVKNLFEIFSKELSQLTTEKQRTQESIIDKIAEILLPDECLIPTPSHAILFAQSTKAFILQKDSIFTYKKNIDRGDTTAGSKDNIEIGFTPVGNIALTTNRVVSYTVNNNFYKVHTNLSKEKINFNIPIVTNYGEVNIILASGDENDKPEALSFYIVCPRFGDNDYIYPLLTYTEVSAEGIPLKIKKGLQYADERAADKNMEQEDEIRLKYDKYFITVEGLSAIWQHARIINKEFKEQGENKALEGLGNNHRFIRMRFKFNPKYTVEVLEDMHIICNAFPVFNRSLKKVKMASVNDNNTVALLCNENEKFLSVNNVWDDAVGNYRQVSFTKPSVLKPGNYLLTIARKQSYTERTATDMIDYLSFLLSDEISSFKSIGPEFINGLLKKVEENFLEVKQRNLNKENQKKLTYITVERGNKNRTTLNADYWVTAGAFADNIPSLTSLTPLQNPANKIIQSLLLTETTGSREITPENSTGTYSYLLHTRDRIITAADIDYFCYKELGSCVVKVWARPEIIISDKPKQGFIRVIKIDITVNNYRTFDKEYWYALAVDLQEKIAARSFVGLDYRVMIMDG